MSVIIELRYVIRNGEKVLQVLEGDIYPTDDGDCYIIEESLYSTWKDVEVKDEA